MWKNSSSDTLLKYLQSVTKCFVKSKKIKKKWTRPENFDICFCACFDLNCRKLIFGGKN